MHVTVILLAAMTAGETQDAAKARAVLTLAAAAAQARPAPQAPVFWERLMLQPALVEGEPPRQPATNSAPAVPAASADTPRRLSLQQALLAAQRMGRPLVVWVGCRDAALEAELQDCVHHHAETWQGSAAPRLVPQLLHAGWWHARQEIPFAGVDAAKVRGELVGLRQGLTTPQATRSVGRVMLPQAPRGQSC